MSGALPQFKEDFIMIKRSNSLAAIIAAGFVGYIIGSLSSGTEYKLSGTVSVSKESKKNTEKK